ncbi:Heparanase-like protein 3 [Zea mays]|uniref:Heparanase-like protein 3 n=1 Tax=Zea mays TaxID=4577 RepID=A0A3L6DH62_MAIZE|nr:Heparanase-like protein 3 [Zea mays]
MAAAGTQLGRLLGGLWFLAALLGRPGATAAVAGQPAAPAVASVDGRRAVAATGEDFVCATLDWWPPDKCDYGTCAWGRAGLLNLHKNAGNELSGTGVGARVGADQYAADVIALKALVDDVYRSEPSKPLVVAPGGFFDQAWFTELVVKTGPDLLSVVTHHVYNLGPGTLAATLRRDTHLIDKILDPSTLDGMLSTFSDLQRLLKSTGTSAVAWVGEAGGAYNSGRHLVTDAFVFSFWFLDQLGMAARFDTKSYCRQSLVGGNYGLLNTTTFQPNPDYYSALLWHRLMGTKVLAVTFSGTNKIRAYAHCARDSPGITLLLINLSGNATARVSVTAQGAAAAHAHRHGARKHGGGRKFRHVHVHVPGGGEAAAGAVRHEYHLTPKDGDLTSQVVMLNGRALATDAAGNIPALEAVEVDAARPIAVTPYSIVFARVPHFSAPACRVE